MNAEEIKAVIVGAEQELAMAVKKAETPKKLRANYKHTEGAPDDVAASLNGLAESANTDVARLIDEIKSLGELQERFSYFESKAVAAARKV
jgi:hypothetical protein